VVTSTKGNQPLEPKLVDGVKVFDVTASVVQWEVAPGEFVEAWAYNGTVPGPLLRVTEGDKIRVVLKNELPEPTVIHIHGPSGRL
jgi:FtsP/CotA-like multicopper oxidase with cupredoxin domain